MENILITGSKGLTGDMRWTARRKKELTDSRVKSGELLYETLRKAEKSRSPLSQPQESDTIGP
ncbi:MAG: hypothetical protein HPY62_09360 [Bacteroidales bacterium]|nr:hypothetical protein [Bacteroidales bacterium]